VVAAISGFVLSCVLILTLIGYVVYAELKNGESKISYRRALGTFNAKIYGKYIDVSGLSARVGDSGALKGKEIVEGTLKNLGEKQVCGLLIKIKFLDRDGAVIYESLIDPMRPALGYGGIPQVTIPYISSRSEACIPKGTALPFKMVLSNCPDEITSAIRGSAGFTKDRGRWSGKIGYELASVEIFDAGAIR